MADDVNNDAIAGLMEALQALMKVPNTELEQAAIKHKINALQNPNTEGLKGIDLIDVMGDQALAIQGLVCARFQILEFGGTWKIIEVEP